MHTSPQEAHSPAFGHQEEREGHTHGSSNPKLGRRIKAAASSFAKTLHIPGSGQQGTSSHHSSGGTPVEHHRVTVDHVTSETSTDRPQWQVQKPHHLEQIQYEMPPSPVTPLRKNEGAAPHEEPLSATTTHKETAPEAETQAVSSTSSARIPPGTPNAGLEHGQIPSTGEEPHHGAGSPSIPTPFSGIESPQRLSSDTDELKPTYIKPLPSLDRSTESQEVYVEDLETLADERRGGVAGGVLTGKSAAEKLKYAMQPSVKEEEHEGEEEEYDGEKHTHAGPSPVYSSSFKNVVGEPRTHLPDSSLPTIDEKRPSEAPAAGTQEAKEQEHLKQEIYAANDAEKQLEREEEEEDQAIAAARLRVEREEEEFKGRGHPHAMTHRLESPSGKIVIPALEVPDTIAVPRRRDTGRAFLEAIQAWVYFNPLLLVLLVAGTVSFSRALWVFFTSTSSTLKDFGPLLFLSGAVALVATALARYVMSGGTSMNPLPRIPESEVSELDVGDSANVTGGPAADAGGGGGALDNNLPPSEQPGPSEPVSKESTEDIIHHPESADPVAGKNVEEEGVLRKVEHAVGGAATAAKEGLIKVMDPGQEMVGEVIQETDTGEKVLLPDTESPLHRAEDAVAHAAAKVKTAVLGGAASEPVVQRNNTGGYTSDSDVPGPVIEGVHPVRDQGHVQI